MIDQLEAEAHSTPFGPSLGLEALMVQVQWKGEVGRTIENYLPTLVNLLRTSQDKPHAIVLHMGSGDLGRTRFHKLRRRLSRGIQRLVAASPRTLLIWSEIPARPFSADPAEHDALERVRVRINNYATTLIKATGGSLLRSAFAATGADMFQDAPTWCLSARGAAAILHIWQRELRILLHQYRQVHRRMARNFT